MVTADDRVSGSRMFGLSNGDSNQGWDDIDFAFELKGDGTLQVYEYGVPRQIGIVITPPTYASGDVLKVAVEYDAIAKKNVVKWYRNNDMLYTSSSPSINYPLLLDTSIYSPGSWIHDAYLCSAGSGSNPGAGSNGGIEGGKKSSSVPSPTSTRAKAVADPNKSTGTGKGGNPLAPDSINVVNAVIYLHSDHLGSILAATSSTGQTLSSQEFDSWGKVRTGA
jgi:hypothetical protein